MTLAPGDQDLGALLDPPGGEFVVDLLVRHPELRVLVTDLTALHAAYESMIPSSGLPLGEVDYTAPAPWWRASVDGR